jgi:hypothetical protein
MPQGHAGCLVRTETATDRHRRAHTMLSEHVTAWGGVGGLTPVLHWCRTVPPFNTPALALKKRQNKVLDCLHIAAQWTNTVRADSCTRSLGAQRSCEVQAQKVGTFRNKSIRLVMTSTAAPVFKTLLHQPQTACNDSGRNSMNACITL